MYRKKMEADIRCPLEYGLKVFGGKWKSRVICVLNEKGVLRYSAIRKEMLNVTDAVLSSTLKELINDGLVARKQYDEIPPRVEYSLTDRGKSVVPILQMGWYFSTGKQRQCDGAVPEMRLQQAIEQSLAVREYVPTGVK